MKLMNRLKSVVYLILLSFLFSNVFITPTYAAVNVGENLLVNPGFEQEALAGWTTAGTSGVASRIGGSVNYNFKTGAYSLRHLSTAAYETFTYQTVSGLPDGIYSVSAWVRRPATAVLQEIAQMEVTVGSVAVGAGYTPTYTKAISAGSSFQQIGIENIVVENGAGQVTVCFHSKAPASSLGTPVLYVDDVEFKLVGGMTTLYTVNFDTTSGSAIEAVQVAQGSTVQKPTDPVKTGYTFEGWYTDNTFETAFNFTAPINSNITLYAKWAEIPVDPENFAKNPGFEEASITEWTITSKGSGSIEKASGVQNINYRSGSFSIKHQSSGTHEAKTAQTISGLENGLYSASAYLRMPTASFDNARMSVTSGVYSTEPQYSVNVTPSSIFALYKIDDILVTDGTLTLAFDTKTGTSGQVLYIDDVKVELAQTVNEYYTVSFNTNGGSTVTDRYAVESKTINPPSAPKKIGYIFGGWYSDSALANLYNFSTPITSNITLYAMWTPVPVDPDNLVQNPGFEKGTSEDWKITSNLPSTATISEGIEKVDYNSGTAALKLTQSKRYEVWVSQTVQGLEKGYYTAKAWVKRPVAVREDDVYRMQILNYGDAAKIANIQGSSEYTQIVIDDIPVTTGKCTIEFYVKTFDNHILYIDDIELKKKDTPYTNLVVNFETSGGSKVYNVIADSGNKITPPTSPTKTGYIFKGWYSDSTLTQAFDFTQPVASDIALYAKWEDNPVPMIGNIRWDVLTGYAPFDELNSLSKEKYNYRAPFFTSIDENYQITGNNNSVTVIEQEINYAATGGIDYWAFTTGPEMGKNNPEYYALDKFLSSAQRNKIGFSIIIHRYDSNPWENRVDMLVKWMQEGNYVQVMGNRPLVYIYRVSELEAKYGAGQGTLAAINLIRTKAQEAGLGNPYIVAMASSTPESLAQNKGYIENYGLDAISAYGYAGERNESNLESYAPYSVLAEQNVASWENYKATGKKMIPLVAFGRNEEPRKDTSVVYGGGHGPFFDNPTATEAAIQVKAGLDFVRNNSGVCESNAILSYAWNEFAEGGWICPTLSEGTSKLDAIAQMKLEYAEEIEESQNPPKQDDDTQVPSPGNSNASSIPVSILTKNTDAKGEVTIDAAETTKLEKLIIKGAVTLELNKSMLKALDIKENVKVTVNEATIPLSDDIKSIVGNRPVYEFSIVVDGHKIRSFGNSKIKVSIPYEKAEDEKANAIIVYYIDAEGMAQPVIGKYNSASKNVDFKTDHFSKFAIGYNEVKFSDVSDEWFYDAVTFISARGIASGVSTGKFGPDAVVTRGQFITMLCRAYVIKERSGDNFSDCGNAYYTGYLAAVKQLGISDGTGNNKFAPEREITREEMFTLLYNAIKNLEEVDEADGNGIKKFADKQEVSPWALEATNYFVESGILNGKGNILAPKEKATRAELAQILYNIQRGRT